MGRVPARGRECARAGAFRRVWAWPLALALVTLFGLLSALLGQEDVWWALAWIALAAPLGTAAACVLRACAPARRLERPAAPR